MFGLKNAVFLSLFIFILMFLFSQSCEGNTVQASSPCLCGLGSRPPGCPDLQMSGPSVEWHSICLLAVRILAYFVSGLLTIPETASAVHIVVWYHLGSDGKKMCMFSTALVSSLGIFGLQLLEF